MVSQIVFACSNSPPSPPFRLWGVTWQGSHACSLIICHPLASPVALAQFKSHDMNSSETKLSASCVSFGISAFPGAFHKRAVEFRGIWHTSSCLGVIRRVFLLFPLFFSPPPAPQYSVRSTTDFSDRSNSVGWCDVPYLVLGWTRGLPFT